MATKPISRRGAKQRSGRYGYVTGSIKNPEEKSLYDYRAKSELPKLGLCKIRTDRFRDMTIAQLQQASFFIGPVTMKERMSRTAPRGLVHRFIQNLLGSRREEDLSERSYQAYLKTYGEEPMKAEHIRMGYEREADRVEREIWDAQQKKGCKISGNELVARDAAREGQPPEIIDKARGKRRPKIR